MTLKARIKTLEHRADKRSVGKPEAFIQILDAYNGKYWKDGRALSKKEVKDMEDNGDLLIVSTREGDYPPKLAYNK